MMNSRAPGPRYVRTFQIGLFEACYKNPSMCILGALLPWCVTYHLRKRVLHGDLKNGYLCCGGYMPCSGRMGESKCPELCLALESALCQPTAVTIARFQLQVCAGFDDFCICASMYILYITVEVIEVLNLIL